MVWRKRSTKPIILIIFALTVVSISEATCLDELAEKMQDGGQIKIATRHNEVVAGKLYTLNLTDQILTIRCSSLVAKSLRTFQANELTMIKYSVSGKSSVGYAMLGAIAGGVLGYGIGTIATGDADRHDMGAAYGRLIMAVGGGLLGMILGITIPKHNRSVTLRCF